MRPDKTSAALLSSENQGAYAREQVVVLERFFRGALVTSQLACAAFMISQYTAVERQGNAYRWPRPTARSGNEGVPITMEHSKRDQTRSAKITGILHTWYRLSSMRWVLTAMGPRNKGSDEHATVPLVGGARKFLRYF